MSKQLKTFTQAIPHWYCVVAKDSTGYLWAFTKHGTAVPVMGPHNLPRLTRSEILAVRKLMQDEKDKLRWTTALEDYEDGQAPPCASEIDSAVLQHRLLLRHYERVGLSCRTKSSGG